jgi:DNA-directed RNA polymerase specialized sigma24 family protein
MGTPGRLDEWAARVLREGIGIGAVFLECRNRGAAPERARQLAEEAVQQALAQAARLVGPEFEGRFESFRHFGNWLTVVAINHVRSVFRQERRRRQLDEAGQATAEAVEPPEPVRLVREFLGSLAADERDLLLASYEEAETLDQLAERFLPPDDRSESGRRSAIWRRRRALLARLRLWLLDNGLGPGDDALASDDLV